MRPNELIMLTFLPAHILNLTYRMIERRERAENIAFYAVSFLYHVLKDEKVLLLI